MERKGKIMANRHPTLRAADRQEVAELLEQAEAICELPCTDENIAAREKLLVKAREIMKRRYYEA